MASKETGLTPEHALGATRMSAACSTSSKSSKDPGKNT
jgi:hypothetical protein